MDGDHVASADNVLDAVMPMQIQFRLDGLGQAMAIVILQVHAKRFEAAQHCEADAAGGDG
jgi:hypothetical protein